MWPEYKLSFAHTRQIGIGLLLGLIIVRSVVSFIVAHYAMSNADQSYSVKQVKRDHFDAIAYLFTSAATTIHDQSLYEQLPLPIDQVNDIQSHLNAIKSLESNELEKKGIQVLRRQHAELWKAISSVAAIEAGETGTIEAATRSEMGYIAAKAIQQAMKLRTHAEVSIVSFKRDSALHLTSVVLTIGTIFTILAGIFVSGLLTWTLSRHVDRITRAIREIGRGNLAYRIHSPFTDEMGQLAKGIDEMAAQLEVSKHRLQETSEALTEARQLSEPGPKSYVIGLRNCVGKTRSACAPKMPCAAVRLATVR